MRAAGPLAKECVRVSLAAQGGAWCPDAAENEKARSAAGLLRSGRALISASSKVLRTTA